MNPKNMVVRKRMFLSTTSMWILVSMLVFRGCTVYSHFTNWRFFEIRRIPQSESYLFTPFDGEIYPSHSHSVLGHTKVWKIPTARLPKVPRRIQKNPCSFLANKISEGNQSGGKCPMIFISMYICCDASRVLW